MKKEELIDFLFTIKTCTNAGLDIVSALKKVQQTQPDFQKQELEDFF